MRIKRVILPAILALGAAGAIVTGSTAAVMAAQSASTPDLMYHTNAAAHLVYHSSSPFLMYHTESPYLMYHTESPYLMYHT